MKNLNKRVCIHICITVLFISSQVLGLVSAHSDTIKFSGYEWEVKSGEKLGPGPNSWKPSNVSVDDKGCLHLKISKVDGVWSCGEVAMTKRLGFGTYQFQIAGRIDQFDKNIVLGIFNYPTPDVGSDGMDEIDIEFAHWGIPDAPIGNYTIWPAKKEVKQTSHVFKFNLKDELTTQRFIWKSKSILCQSLRGHRDDDKEEFGRWLFEPKETNDRIPQQPLPVLLNLWLFEGHPPSDGKEVEIVIKNFKFTPEQQSVSR